MRNCESEKLFSTHQPLLRMEHCPLSPFPVLSQLDSEATAESSHIHNCVGPDTGFPALSLTVKCQSAKYISNVSKQPEMNRYIQPRVP